MTTAGIGKDRAGLDQPTLDQRVEGDARFCLLAGHDGQFGAGERFDSGDARSGGIDVILFAFDAAKPGPVAWADQLFKGFGPRGAWGIMWDDLVAVFCTLLLIALWRF